MSGLQLLHGSEDAQCTHTACSLPRRMRAVGCADNFNVDRSDGRSPTCHGGKRSAGKSFGYVRGALPASTCRMYRACAVTLLL